MQKIPVSRTLGPTGPNTRIKNDFLTYRYCEQGIKSEPHSRGLQKWILITSSLINLCTLIIMDNFHDKGQAQNVSHWAHYANQWMLAKLQVTVTKYRQKSKWIEIQDGVFEHFDGSSCYVRYIGFTISAPDLTRTSAAVFHINHIALQEQHLETLLLVAR